jgi:hypothetical protein
LGNAACGNCRVNFAAMLVVHGVAIASERPEWPRDLRIFGAICAAWGVVLLCRVIFLSSSAEFQDVLSGVKFYANTARLTMTIQAAVFIAFGVAIFARLRWGLLLGLLYFAQVVVGHLIFLAKYVHIPDQAVHVKIASVGSPFVLAILIYLWMRARPMLRRAPVDDPA